MVYKGVLNIYKKSLFIIKLFKKNLIFLNKQSIINLLLSSNLNALNRITLPAGFEPAAHCLEGSCSIQLS